MRIALFTDTYPPQINGVAASTFILRNELEKHGHDVVVVTTYKGSGKHKWDDDHKVLVRLSREKYNILLDDSSNGIEAKQLTVTSHLVKTKK